MFTETTVFVLGAGASWHYGYPTGEGLVKRIIEKAGHASLYFEHSARESNSLRPDYLINTAKAGASIRTQWETARQECEELKAGLQQVNPLVIDYFLGWNPKLQSIGRLLIAWVIMECEDVHRQLGGNINRKQMLLDSPLEADRMQSRNVDLKKYKDDWCRFVIHQLAINCKTSSDIFRNRVHFVTFNYDVSLERALYQGLRHIQIFEAEDVDKFLAGDRVMHVYGKVREKISEPPPTLKWSEQGRDPRTLTSQEQWQYHHDHKA